MRHLTALNPSSNSICRASFCTPIAAFARFSVISPPNLKAGTTAFSWTPHIATARTMPPSGIRCAAASSSATSIGGVAKDGRTVWIQASYNPILDTAGRPSKIVKFATDTTDAKLLALENGAKIAAIGRSQGIIEFSIQGTILDANENFLRMTGYALPEIQGHHHSIFVPFDERDGPAYRAFWDKLRQGLFQAAEYRRIGKGGQDVWIQATYNPVFDLDGRLTKVVKFATDITAGVKQREQMQLLSLVADQTGHSVVMTDLDGHIDYVNAGFTRMTGYSFAEVRGRRPGDVLQGPLTSQATRARLRERISRRQPVQERDPKLYQGGEPYWISLFINLVTDENGLVRRFVSIQTDITQRRKLEEQSNLPGAARPLDRAGQPHPLP